ncbi:MAG TPA: NADH-quinone oxidoreductase subunit N [Acidobacteriaceae bacterium]|nr:NADH-quinone oxidoreductase subunit N [Acidobacteriaceae bacterium]
MTSNYAQLLNLALPQVIVVITALIVITIDALFLRTRPTHTRFTIAASLASAGCAAAILRIILSSTQANLFNGAFIATPLTHLLQITLLALTILTLLLATHSAFTEHVSEYILLILLATTGMLFLVATEDLLVIFLSLELLSLSLYILTAFNKHSPHSSEYALKYFLFGGMSAAFLLFGFSLLYGLANSTNLTQIATATHGTLSPILLIAIVTTALGLGFKIAAAPFHFWAPDVYQGAPAPSAAFIASSSKVASFFLFFEIVTLAFPNTEGTAAFAHSSAALAHSSYLIAHSWSQNALSSPLHIYAPILALMAVLSMLLGNLVAIRQTSLRRLLAYSAIAHAGYMLLALLAPTPQSLAALLYYVITYALATLGTFAVISIVEEHHGTDHLASFAGLAQQSPALAFALAVFILSLAGIPPLAGFFGKFYLFSTVLTSTPRVADLLWLIILAIAMSAVSLYYYLRILKRVYVTPAPETTASNIAPIHPSIFTQVLILTLAAATMILGCAPNLILTHIQSAIHFSGF